MIKVISWFLIFDHIWNAYHNILSKRIYLEILLGGEGRSVPIWENRIINHICEIRFWRVPVFNCKKVRNMRRKPLEGVSNRCADYPPKVPTQNPAIDHICYASFWLTSNRHLATVSPWKSDFLSSSYHPLILTQPGGKFHEKMLFFTSIWHG